MQIAQIYYPLKVLGYGNRIGIWTIGCPQRCPNCTSPELLDPDPSKELPLTEIARIFQAIRKQAQSIDGVTISGGEPFYYPADLYELIIFLKQEVSKDILIYTGYTIEELRGMNNSYVDGILINIAVLIDGPYIEGKNDNRALRGSSNQRIHFLKKSYADRYRDIIEQPRAVQNIFVDKALISIGIPQKDSKIKLQQKLRKRGIKYGGRTKVAP